MNHTYIATGNKRELMRFGVDSDQKSYVVQIVGGGGMVAIHSS